MVALVADVLVLSVVSCAVIADVPSAKNSTVKVAVPPDKLCALLLMDRLL